MKKKVLIVAYYWPPAGGPGVQRWLKFVKYLPSFDVEPIVYVPENPVYPIIDTKLQYEVSDDVTIIKTPIREPLRWASALSRKQTKNISSGLIPNEKEQSLLQRMMLWVRGNLFIPDARVGWVRPSVGFLEPFIVQEGIDTIITTGPPHSMHLIGLGLKKKIPNLKWYADFRDPWTTIGYHTALKMGKRAEVKHKRLEKEVLNTADAVIVTSPTTKTEFEELTAKPIHVITNGFDDDFAETPALDERFVVAHIGSLLAARNPKVLWHVLADLVKTNTSFKKSFVLQFVGKVSDEVLFAVKNAGLEPFLEIKGYVSHDEAQQLQRKAHLLLLVEIDRKETRGIIAGKVYEYLAAQRPILAVGPKQGDVGTILEHAKAGSYHHYDEAVTIKEVLLHWFDVYEQGLEYKAPPYYKKYHRKALTEQLAQVLKD